MGALARAREWDVQAVALARERGWGPEPDALLNLCVDDVREGRAEEAAAILAELEARAARTAWLQWISDLRLAAVGAEHWLVRADCDRADAYAQRLAAVAARLGSRDYACTAERVRAEVALARGEGLEAAAERLAEALGALKGTPAPLEAWKSGRVLAAVRRRLGDGAGAREALGEAAAAIETIAASTREGDLRESFLALPAVREVREGRVAP
jgi:hypothetical protein